jgi:hypothetical protein
MLPNNDGANQTMALRSELAGIAHAGTVSRPLAKSLCTISGSEQRILGLYTDFV